MLHDRLVGFQPGTRSAASERGGCRRDNNCALLVVRGLAKEEKARQGFAQGGEADCTRGVEGQVRDQQEMALQVLMPGRGYPEILEVGTRGFMAIEDLRSNSLLQVGGLHLEREEPHDILRTVQIFEQI